MKRPGFVVAVLLATLSAGPAQAANDCKAGTSAPEGTTKCIKPSAGYIVPGKGATTQTPCPAGTFKVSSRGCSKYRAGTFTPGEARTSCIIAGTGR